LRPWFLLTRFIIFPLPSLLTIAQQQQKHLQTIDDEMAEQQQYFKPNFFSCLE
jgi:hypothetical protein